jgi:hypothetical protein
MAGQPDSETPQAVIGALLVSGFPFQTAVAQVVRQCRGYKVAAEEFSWRDETGADQFLDLVAERGHVVLPIECKKTQKDILTFLWPTPSESDVNRARCVYLFQAAQDPSRRIELFCSDWQLVPKSAESAFCVVSTSGSGKDQRMLERDAQQLIKGTDACAQRYRRDRNVNVNWAQTLMIPVLVTNAKLFVAQYDPSSVSLDTGEFEMPLSATIVPVQWVRFRKSFTSVGKDAGDRTIFVVAASALQEFLGRLDVFSDGPAENGKTRIS